jgi:Flp pilus assembly protein TadD
MDDFSVIVNNPDIRSISDFLANTFPGRPLRELTYLVDYQFFGLDPFGYHFQNIFWHGLNCWLVYLLALRLKLSLPVAWFSAILFLVHPIHVEVVANSSHRKDSLALAFLLLALLSYMKTTEQTSQSGRVTWLTATLVLWITAFFAKGNTIVFPALVVAYEYALVPEENRLIVRWKQMVPFICYAAAFSLVVWYFYIIPKPAFKTAIIGAFVKTDNLADFSATAYVLMVLKSCAFMVSKLILPVNLSMEYIYSVPESFLDPWVVAALVLIPTVIAAAYRWRTRAPEYSFLLLLSVVLWLPTSNFVWHFSYFAADRYMYAPSAGLCILAVLASEKACTAGRRFVAVWMPLLCVCSFLSWQQTRIWLNDQNLYSHMLKVSPRSLEAMIGLSNAYYLVKNYETSAEYAKMAIERDFTDFRPYLILGNINFVRNRLNDALELLLEAQKKNPLSPEVHNAIGSVYDDLGLTVQAIDSLKTALTLRPTYCEAYTNLGVAYERAGDYATAETALKKALSLNGNHAPAWFSLGVVRYKNNDKNGSRTAFSEVLKRDVVHVDALTNLSVVCKELGDDACFVDAERRLRLLTKSNQDSLRH